MNEAIRQGLASVLCSLNIYAGSCPTTLALHRLTTYPDAVCNDGSASGYYWAAGRANSSDWIVLLESGGWCWDAPSCAKRCADGSKDHRRCTSSGWQEERSFSGLLASKAPRLANANKVYVPYCTSDAHVGDATAFGMEFRGAAVVRAVLRDLVMTRGLGGRGADAPPARLLFGGLSAGSRGAMVHLDSVQGMLPLVEAARLHGAASAAWHPGVQRVQVRGFPRSSHLQWLYSLRRYLLRQVRGFLDSAAWLDLQPLRPTPPSFYGLANATRQVVAFANVSHLDTDRGEADPGTNTAVHPGKDAAGDADAEQRWRGLFGEHRLPAIRTPYLLLASQFDSYQLDMNFGGCGHWSCDPTSAEQRAFAWRFANATAHFAHDLALGKLNPLNYQRFVYSSRCHRHAASLTDTNFLMGGCGGLSVEQALLTFLEEPQTLPRAWVDNSCDGFDCCCRPPDTLVSGTAAAAAAVLLLCCGCCGAAMLRTRARRRRCRQRVDRLRACMGLCAPPQRRRSDMEVTLVDAWEADSAASQPGAEADAGGPAAAGGRGEAHTGSRGRGLQSWRGRRFERRHESPGRALRATTLSPVPESVAGSSKAESVAGDGSEHSAQGLEDLRPPSSLSQTESDRQRDDPNTTGGPSATGDAPQGPSTTSKAL